MKSLYIILAIAFLSFAAQAQTAQPSEWSSGHPITVGGESHIIADKTIGAGDSAHVFGRFNLVDEMGVRYDSAHIIISYSDSIDGTLYLKFYTNTVGLIQDTTGFAIQQDGDGVTLEFSADAQGFTLFTWHDVGLVTNTVLDAASCIPVVVLESGSATASDGEKFSVAFIGYHKDRN